MRLFSATAENTTKISFISNVLLFFLKLAGGILGRSSALLADALNSLLDMVANIVVWIGLAYAKRPADEGHPYGHGHADTIAALFVALLLVVTGVYIGVNAIHVIIDRDYKAPDKIATMIAAFTIVVKELLYQWTIRAGRRANSPAVIANAHDHRADVYASSGALIGIVVAQMGIPIFDPIAGFWIGLLILKNAVKLITENLHFLMGGAPDSSITRKIAETAGAHPGVEYVRKVKVRSAGSTFITDLKIMVNGELTVRKGHDIAADLKVALMKSIDNLQDVMIHVEPVDELGRKDES
jgi:cation diffusion facilitator family transporter